MATARQLRDTWMSALEGKLARFAQRQRVEPKEFSNRLNRLCDELVTNMRNAVEQETKNKDLADRVRARFEDQYGRVWERDGEIGKLRQEYRKVHDQRAALASERKQQDWATTWDYGKAFLWRTAQAIAFAIVILGASLVADRYGIPIPLLRI